jgi:hypothetical protein
MSFEGNFSYINKGIKVAGLILLTHLFVNDVMLFGLGTLQEMNKFKEILELLPGN